MADDDDGGGVDWSGLPPRLVTHIFKHLTLFLDYLCARFACKNWESALPLTQTLLLPQPPWLMFPSMPRSPATRLFFDLPARRAHFVPVPLPNPDPDTHCFSSSHGWLFFLGRSPTLSLFNPVTRDVVRLPGLDTLPAAVLRYQPKINAEYVVRSDHPAEEEVELPRRRLIRFAVLSSDPAADPEFEVLLFLFRVGKLVFRFRNGAADSWAPIELPAPLLWIRNVIYIRELLTVAVVDGTDNSLLFLVLPDEGMLLASAAVGIPDLPPSTAMYLARTPKDGNVLLVTRHEFTDAVRTGIAQFRVFLIRGGRRFRQPMTAEEVNDMADFALFVGYSSSVCVDTAVFPQYKANSIYFTHGYYKTVRGCCQIGETVGRYDLQLRRVDGTYHLDVLEPPISLLRPAMWITPSLRKIVCAGGVGGG